MTVSSGVPSRWRFSLCPRKPVQTVPNYESSLHLPKGPGGLPGVRGQRWGLGALAVV